MLRLNCEAPVTVIEPTHLDSIDIRYDWRLTEKRLASNGEKRGGGRDRINGGEKK